MVSDIPGFSTSISWTAFASERATARRLPSVERLSALGVDLDGLDRMWKASLGYGGNAMRPARVVDTGNDDPGNEWLGWALASGSLVMGGVAILALFSAWKSLRRNTDETELNEADDPTATRPGPPENAW